MRWLGFFLDYVQLSFINCLLILIRILFVLAIVGSDMFMCSLFGMY